MSAPTRTGVQQEYADVSRAVQRMEVIAGEHAAVLRVLQARRDALRDEIEEREL
jgi:hypothetical protein